MKRGKSQFEVDDVGNLINCAANVQALRRLWLNRDYVSGEQLGPGDPGDFDYGAWHVACHLVAGAGVMRAADERPMWLGVSHDPRVDEYYASVSIRTGDRVQTLRVESADGRSLLQGAKLLGFVEGTSRGRISARGANDRPTDFNLWRRQDFDQPLESQLDGGRVWEHWCTLRDIRPTARVGSSVISAYVALVAVLGDRFAPTVARGRNDYGHPIQLAALVHAGFTAESSALWDTTPLVVPSAAERLLLESEPGKSLETVHAMKWDAAPCYYMFSRAIGKWTGVSAARDAIEAQER